MTRRHRGRRARAGFTLIELLVVIAIIAVLVSLTASAVMMILVKGPQVQTRTEIGDLEGGVANAKANLNNVSYIPSRLVLRDDGQYGTTTTGQQQIDELRTKLWLQQAFGKNIYRTGPNGSFGPIDWNNNGNTTDVVTLNGAQCLVFVLGGIQPNGPPGTGFTTGTGFSTNPTNPVALPVPGATRKGPFYEFKQNRLVTDPINQNGFMVYLDPYGTYSPYLYMSWYGKGNDYNSGNNSDCASYGVTPYVWNNRFLNANGFQIISGGQNGGIPNTPHPPPPGGGFGPGGIWNPATGYGGSGPGADDQANFSGAILGAPQR